MKYKELRDELKLATKVALELAGMIDTVENLSAMHIIMTPEVYDWLEAHDKKGKKFAS
jgi:hypothetical protein